MGRHGVEFDFHRSDGCHLIRFDGDTGFGFALLPACRGKGQQDFGGEVGGGGPGCLGIAGMELDLSAGQFSGGGGKELHGSQRCFD